MNITLIKDKGGREAKIADVLYIEAGGVSIRIEPDKDGALRIEKLLNDQQAEAGETETLEGVQTDNGIILIPPQNYSSEDKD